MSSIKTYPLQSQANNMSLLSQKQYQLKGLKPIYKISIISLVIFGALLAVNLYSQKEQSLLLQNLIGNVNSRFLNSQESIEQINGNLEGVQNNQVEWMYEDPNYGFKSNSQILLKFGWMPFQKQTFSVMKNQQTFFQQNYLKLDYQKMFIYWSSVYSDFTDQQKLTQQLLLDGQFNCTVFQEQYGIRPCLSQWADLKLGSSVSELNKTMLVELEISALQMGYFKQYVNPSSKYQDIKFAKEWAIKVIKINEDHSSSENSNHTLLDKDNLSFLFSNRQKYNQTQDNSYLEEISERFLISKFYFGDSYLDTAYLFWEYAVYMVDVFSEFKNYKNGGFEVYEKSLFDSQKFSITLQRKLVNSSFQIANDNLAIKIIGALMLENFKTKEIKNCESFIYHLQNAQYLCEIESFKKFDLQTMRTIQEFKIYFLYSPQCSQYRYMYNFDIVNTVIQEVEQQKHSQYECVSEIQKCSCFEIAAKQLYNLEVIRKLPAIAVPYLPTGRDSVSQSIPNHKPYEWGYHVEKYGKTFSQPPANLTYNQTSQLLDYNLFFQTIDYLKIFLIDSNFTQNYFFQDPSQIRSYFD
ncbi:hypothetical protein ABPG72_022426 [Tetrahymena utriculariae]